jgi:hypothetical protein
MRPRHAAAILALAAALAGCGGVTRYTPVSAAPSEIVLRDDDGLELRAGGGRVAAAHRYQGLARFVGCVPAARGHALSAERDGATGMALTYAGAGFAAAGLAGLGGLAFQGKDDTAMIAFFSAGIGAEVVGLVLVAVGRQFKLDAMGHAVDAANFYNDAVGSAGGSCAPR